MANLTDAEKETIAKRKARRKKFRAGAKYPPGWPVKVGGRDCTVLHASIANTTGEVSYFVADGKAERKVPATEVTGDEPEQESTSPDG